jgi:hypothetical protein
VHRDERAKGGRDGKDDRGGATAGANVLDTHRFGLS